MLSHTPLKYFLEHQSSPPPFIADYGIYIIFIIGVMIWAWYMIAAINRMASEDGQKQS
jgi:hypothetical protein